jgi:hypothetical protein
MILKRKPRENAMMADRHIPRALLHAALWLACAAIAIPDAASAQEWPHL